MESINLIVPAAGPSKDGRIPKIFRSDEYGLLHCVRSIMGLPLERFSTITFTILEEHARDYDIESLLRLQFKRLGIESARIVVLEKGEPSQAATVAETIRRCGIKGPIFIKDADNYFEADPRPRNCVAVYALEDLEMVDPRHKSYVAVDDMNFLTNIIERRIIGHLFSAGGYGFESADEFMAQYMELCDEKGLFLSHIIYALLLKGRNFRPLEVEAYQDFN